MRSKLWLPLLLGALFWIWDFDDGTAYADVRDTTGTFSQQTIEQANKVIEEIHQKYNKDVVVEVFPTIPQNLRAKYDPSRKDQFFEQWQQQRAKELNLDGVHILITRDPGRIEVGAGGETSKLGFTSSDRETVTQRMAARFRNQEFDQGLLDGVNYIRQSFFANLGPRSGQPNYNVQTPTGGAGGGTQAPAPRRPGLSMFWWLIIIGVGLFLLMRLMRRRQQAHSPAYGGPAGHPGNYGRREPYHGQQYPGGAPAGGGWGRGMLGGLLGGVAGGWLYDRMRGGGDPGGGGGAAYGGEPGAPPVQSDQGEGFTSSGADFGGGGGGDIGGGGGGDGGSSGADF